MSSASIGAFTLIVSLLCLVVAAMALGRARIEDRARLRQQSVMRHRGILRREYATGPLPLWARLLSRVGQSVLSSGLLSQKTVQDLEQTVAATGTRAGPKLALFIGAKLVLAVGLPLLALTLIRVGGLHLPVTLAMLAMFVVGLLLPDMYVRRMRSKYLKQVDLGMPAALDLLIICAEAGLSLEGGLERVAAESRVASAATANEFRICANEMKILDDRRQALINVGVRTKLDSAMRLGSALAQSLKYGTPLTQALRVLAAEMRQTALTRFEERAARIPVLLTIPMILFILPCIFVVVGGPAAVRVVQVFLQR